MSTTNNKYPKRPVRTPDIDRACQGARLICTAFHQPLQVIRDPTQHRRLVSKLTQIIQSDPLHEPGKRVLAAGDMSLLEGFDFCIKQPMLRLFPVFPTVLINRAAGYCRVDFPTFIPATAVSTQATITHISLTAVVAELDFEQERFVSDVFTTKPLPKEAEVGLALPLSIPAGSRLPIVVAVGIRLLQVINGAPYELMQGGKVALQVVKAERLEDRKSGVESRELGVERRELGVESQESGVKRRKPGVSRKQLKPALRKH